jgi:hypothetical protein
VVRKPSAGRTRNRRGSPEAIAKRRAGRAFNLLLGSGSGRRRLDGRSQKRRERLLHELRTGRTRGSHTPLKPLDVLARVNELLELGESASVIRRVCRGRAPAADPSALVQVVADLHRAYGFRAEAYRLLGLDDAVLRAAGVLDHLGPETADPDQS